MSETSPKLPRHEWANRFAWEWSRLVDGHCDMEEMHQVGLTLARVVDDQMPEAVAAKYFETDDELEDRVRDAEGAFTDLAAELGIIKHGDRLDDVQKEFAYGVVDLCAAIGDRYGDKAYGNAGDHIRSVYGPV